MSEFWILWLLLERENRHIFNLAWLNTCVANENIIVKKQVSQVKEKYHKNHSFNNRHADGFGSILWVFLLFVLFWYLGGADLNDILYFQFQTHKAHFSNIIISCFIMWNKIPSLL